MIRKSRFKKLLSTAVAVCAAIAVLGGCGGSAGSVDSGSSEPVESETAQVTSEAEEIDIPAYYSCLASFTAEDIDGNAVTEDIFSGSELTLVNIWGTFCGPCLQEMPDLASIAAQYDTKDFQIIGVVCDATDENGSADSAQVEYAKELIQETGASYTHILPTGELAEMNGGIMYVPTSVFVNSEGQVVSSEYIGSVSLEEWQEIIEKERAALAK